MDYAKNGKAGKPKQSTCGWKWLSISATTSVGSCLLRFAIGVFVCWLGWLLIDATGCYDALGAKCHCRMPSAGAWIVAGIGAAIDVCGVAYAYRTWSRLLGHVGPLVRIPRPFGVILALFGCVIAYFGFIALLTFVKKPRIGQSVVCVWDILILIAFFKAIWRFFVGKKTQQQNCLTTRRSVEIVETQTEQKRVAEVTPCLDSVKIATTTDKGECTADVEHAISTSFSLEKNDQRRVVVFLVTFIILIGVVVCFNDDRAGTENCVFDDAENAHLEEMKPVSDNIGHWPVRPTITTNEITTSVDRFLGIDFGARGDSVRTCENDRETKANSRHYDAELNDDLSGSMGVWCGFAFNFRIAPDDRIYEIFATRKFARIDPAVRCVNRIKCLYEKVLRVQEGASAVSVKLRSQTTNRTIDLNILKCSQSSSETSICEDSGYCVIARGIDYAIVESYHSEPKLNGCFGMYFGSEIVPDKKMYCKDADLHLFEPRTQFRKYATYAVAITPISHKVYKIVAMADGQGAQDDEHEQENVRRIMEAKYGLAFERTSFKPIGSGPWPCDYRVKLDDQVGLGNVIMLTCKPDKKDAAALLITVENLDFEYCARCEEALLDYQKLQKDIDAL